MNAVTDFIVRRSKLIECIFVVVVLLSAICFPFVGVNYDLSEYLPERVSSKQGLNVMEAEFGYPGTARIMIGPVSLYEAKIYKNRIENVDGVDMVMWLDSTVNIYESEIFIDYSDIRDYYKDEYAVMDVTFDEGDTTSLTHRAIDEIKEITGDKGYFAGAAVANKSLSETLTREVAKAMALAVIMIWLILCITTTSWFEPFLFLTIMGIAIIINMGTNIFLGTISFLTFSMASILQLAIAMDYSIFLLHSFTAGIKKGLSREAAIKEALKNAVTSILSSGATTIVGFIVLTLMEFSIGRDLGIVLAKGIVISLLTVLFLMPALILKWYDKIEKTAHRPFVPGFGKFGKFVYKVRFITLALTLLITIPSYFAQNMNSFKYGNDALGSSEGTKVYEDGKLIDARFGRSNLILLLVPSTSNVVEKELVNHLESLEYVKNITSLADTLPEGVPESFMPRSIVSQLHTDSYARILINIGTATESDLAFACSNEIGSIAGEYYTDDYYVVGVTPSTWDIKNVITEDYSRVNILSLLGVAVVIMLTFKSLIIPIVVLIPIEAAIFINMAMPYLLGDEMIFMGYIIVSCLQLGATVDYSILVTNNYLNAREELEKKEAAIEAIKRSALSVITSGVILITVGYGLYFNSSVSAVADIGRLVGRGAFFSVILVLMLLPLLMIIFDKLIFNQKRRLDKLIEKRRNMRAKLHEGIEGKLDKLTHGSDNKHEGGGIDENI